MSRNARIALILAVATVALIAGVALRQGTDDAPQPDAAASRQLLAIELPDTAGQLRRVEQWKGKVVVLNFWATWCAPCREEIPVLIGAQQRLGARGVQVVGIAIDQLEKVKPYFTEMGINYPVLVGDLDLIDLSRAAGNEVGGLPFTVVLDRNGDIVRTALGGVTQAMLDEMVLPLL